ncbi:MAG TPA: dTMP kinase [Caulobacteraceae bacterium]|nr:dTMP kinase [Caulobacteraceae bacterium]
MTRGRLITLEGGEGAGKSTQARRLLDRLAQAGIDAIATREPGGSLGAEAIRALLVTGTADRWSAETETLLLYAARADHLQRTIRPALETGTWVVCDRFADSTRAYQGAAGGAPEALIAGLEAAVVGADRPDLTLMFDLPAEAGLARAQGRGGAEDRFEGKGLAFHRRLRERFLAIAQAEPERCAVIDAAAGIEAVAEAVWTAVKDRLL